MTKKPRARRSKPSALTTAAKRRAVRTRPVIAPAPRKSSTRDRDRDASLPPFTIVAIGASAGGLEALTQLLQNVTPNTGMAFVVLQHLAARHDSALPELLGSASAMPVSAATHGMTLAPDRVYVMPPNVQMSVNGGRLRLAPRPDDRSQHTPIDHFFRSLAEDAQSNAIGVVLSGSASDGALGLREIKAAGGITIAQAPQTARYDGMPRAAMATGAVDLVLAPDEIARELTRLSQHPFVTIDPYAERPEKDLADHELTHLFALLRSASGVDFTHYKLPTIRRRLQRRMALHRIPTLTDYLTRLEKDPSEVRELYRDLLIHVTRFFREPESFEVLQTRVFPQIVNDAGGKRPIRVWVPGCSTGEEAYSIAIALIEHLGEQADSTPIQVFATDVSEESIERARLGTYGPSLIADVSPERLRRFFRRVDGRYRINKAVRDSCIFARQDITRDPPFSKLDLIVCRNVMIYLGPRLQRKLIVVFHYALRPSGFVMLGGNESIGPNTESFAVVDNRHKLFSKRQVPVDKAFDLSTLETGAVREPFDRSPIHTAAAAHTDIHSEVTRTLLGRYSPPGVVVDHEFQIVHTRGKTGPFLELASGDPSLNLLKMTREGLLHPLRSALREARKTLKQVRREHVTVHAYGADREVNLQVIPVGDTNSHPHYLVIFEPASRAIARAPSARVTHRRGKGRLSEFEQLQQELTTSREYLQTIIQDLEAANEELQSANEEILSSNEELQSTNEELDTTKEELQSTNEELNTVNEQLNARNDELSFVNSDLINLLTAVPAAIVIVNADLKIRRFTPLAEQTLNLIPADVGRPLGDIKPNIDIADLESLTRDVIEEVTPKELEVRDRSGRFYALRIRPCKNQDSTIDGAVLAFTDVDEARRTEVPPDARSLAQSLLQAVSVGVIVLDDTLRIQSINGSARSLIHAAQSDGLGGRRLRDLTGRQWKMADLERKLERLRSSNEAFSHLRVALSEPEAGQLRIDGHRVAAGPARAPMILLTLTADNSVN